MSADPLKTILYVDDDDDIRTVATFALEIVGGFEVIACGSGREALAAVATVAPQLLILDVMMPEMDGPSLLAELRQQPATRLTPAIFMTAKVQREEIERFMALGAIDVIAKPFDPMALPDSIRQSWQKARSMTP